MGVGRPPRVFGLAGWRDGRETGITGREGQGHRAGCMSQEPGIIHQGGGGHAQASQEGGPSALPSFLSFLSPFLHRLAASLIIKLDPLCCRHTGKGRRCALVALQTAPH